MWKSFTLGNRMASAASFARTAMQNIRLDLANLFKPNSSPLTRASGAVYIWKYSHSLIKSGLAALLFDHYICGFGLTVGPSMLPTLNIAGDWVLIERISWRNRRLALGDIVICTSPVNPSRLICKRVLGLPGDIVCTDPRMISPKWIKVPEGCVWLQGDNFQNSKDSREFGPVPMGLIRGHVFFRFWPWYMYPMPGLEFATQQELDDLGVNLTH